MSESSSKVQRKVRPLTYVAAGVSVLVSGAWWFYLVGPVADLAPNYFEYHIVDNIAELVLAALISISLNIAAGWRGGIDRRICIVAGIILASPAVFFALAGFIR